MVVLVALACAVLFSAIAPRGVTASIASPPASRSAAPAGAAVSTGASTIYVHILGEVNDPGLYELHDGSRAVDVVAAAGGFTKKADQTSVNLARFLTDGEQIIVPEFGATVPSSTSTNTAGAKVNLNTADETALETLPRVGPALAARIVAWRTENGRFTSIDDLKSVSGIGDKTFDDLKELVTV